jgi:hypothetical protein
MTCSITTGSTGRSIGPVLVALILSTTSRLDWSATSPKIVSLPLRCRVAVAVMKNCEPFVP